MQRRSFLKGTFITAGSLLVGGAAVYRYLTGQEQPEESKYPQAIEKMTKEGSKKNVLVLMSSATRKGNTDNLADAYIKGVSEKGYSVTKVYLGSMQLEGCHGCGACQHNNHRCVLKDGMQDIYPLFAECDTLVMASPMHFWTISSRLKAFIERLYAISTEDKYPEKEMVLLMTSGDNKETTFDQPVRYFHILSEIFGNKEKGMYLAGDCKGCEEETRNIDGKHLDNAYKLGLEL
ncbi:flavodoxin family protein [Prevotella sp. 10(H)]|uniref:flavodoxin family protein n=1 Tax=Prevotella sp. 10(H) TaxID=1158294 RepID=UPI0004A6CEF0|nr:flavodoxin family protein [Prevotella sp. 10(H)]